MTNRKGNNSRENSTSGRKTVSASRARVNEIVMPNDTNPLGNLMGGRLMQWMDICSAISAQRHCNKNVVTVAADSIEFKNPVKSGELVVIEGEVTRTFNTSMEIAMEAWAENLREGERRICTTSFYTFVALDEDGNTVSVPPIIPETEFEKERYEQAAKRREVRLEMSKKAKEAHEKDKSQ